MGETPGRGCSIGENMLKRNTLEYLKGPLCWKTPIRGYSPGAPLLGCLYQYILILYYLQYIEKICHEALECSGLAPRIGGKPSYMTKQRILEIKMCDPEL